MSPRNTLIAALSVAACTSTDPPRGDASADARDAASDLVDARDVTSDVSLPDLRAELRFPLIQERVFLATSCDVLEGCTMPGRRRLLRFDLTTPNLGDGDLVLGPPVVEGRAQPGFEWGECHGHFHFSGYADYRLVALDGREVARGHKQAFCLEDTDRARVGGPLLSDAERFNCDRQGIHAGWQDVYGRGLDCQYVDITDVPAGRYRIRATVNPEGRIAESDYSNNVGEFEVEVSAWNPDAGVSDAGVDAGVVNPTLPCTTSEQGAHRDCGWDAEPSARRCTPGASVTLGCDARCGPTLGFCAGDTMLRVCEGEAPCDDLRALATNDDACEADGARDPCSRVTFTCPASGSYRVLAGAYRAGAAYTCRAEAR